MPFQSSQIPLGPQLVLELAKSAALEDSELESAAEYGLQLASNPSLSCCGCSLSNLSGKCELQVSITKVFIFSLSKKQ